MNLSEYCRIRFYESADLIDGNKTFRYYIVRRFYSNKLEYIIILIHIAPHMEELIYGCGVAGYGRGWEEGVEQVWRRDSSYTSILASHKHILGCFSTAFHKYLSLFIFLFFFSSIPDLTPRLHSFRYDLQKVNNTRVLECYRHFLMVGSCTRPPR